MEWKYLHVYNQHSYFAPVVETNRITYNSPIFGTVKRVRLRITDGDGNKVFEQELDAADGLPRFAWDGSINHNPPNGEPPYVNPMRSPFVAEVHGLIKGTNEQPITKPKELSDKKSPTSLVSKCKDEEVIDEDPVTDEELVYAEPESPEPTGKRWTTTFRVQFHSIEVKRGATNPMTANFVNGSNKKRCKQLNDLGYYAGPADWVGKNDFRGDYFTKARARYGSLLAGGNVDTRLGASWEPCPGVKRSTNNGWAAFAEGDDMHGAALRCYVESLPYVVNGETNGLRDQLTNDGAQYGRAGQEAAILNRPLIPFEVRLLVRRSNGQGVFVPQAVGKARIDWTIDVPEERWNNIGGNSNNTSRYGRRYVKQAKQALGGTAGLQGNARRKINCTQTELGGAAVGDQWKAAAVIGDNIIGPHGASLDNDRKLVVTYASVDTNEQDRLGKAVLMFRPSMVAGDRYKLTAHAYFRGHARRGALRKKNPTLKKTSGDIEVWRWAPVGVVLNWGSSKTIDNDLWSSVRPRFAEAYTEIDTSRMLNKTPSQLLQQGDYSNWISGSVSLSRDEDIRRLCTNAFSAVPSDDSIIALNSPSQGTLAAPNGGWDALRPLTKKQYENKPAKRIAAVMRKAFDSPEDREPNVLYGGERFVNMIEVRARALRPRGFVIANLGFGTALQDAGIVPNSIEEKMLGMVRACMGERDMHVIMWDHRPEEFSYLIAHEMAHCLGLRHHENAGDDNPDDHDLADHNCVMSYSGTERPHQRANVYSPMFCGKCNLKIRGWKVHTGLIARST